MRGGGDSSCVDCGKAHSQALSEFLAQSPKDKPFKCQVCGDTFSVGCLFSRHIESHEEVKGRILYQCEVCGAIFEKFLSLFSHRRQMHSDSQQQQQQQQRCDATSVAMGYVCTQCHRAFICESDLKRHTRLVHYVEKAFVCEICGRSFSQRCNLVFHRHTHTGEQPFACELCGKRFARPGNLAIHLHTHSQPAPQLPLSVQLNNKCSAHGDKPLKIKHQQLKNHHMQQRSCSDSDAPYRCDICGDGYSKYNELKEHVQLHQAGDGKLAFKCNNCGKQFLHSYMLLRHKLSHKGRLCQSSGRSISRIVNTPQHSDTS